ncbi:MAG: methyltransferase domain-containing protein [Thermoleophilaceae bacterium]
MALDYDALKDRSRAVWSLGDYSRIAPLTMPAAEALVDACAISAGQEVLDVAAGTGNAAILAAREGAAVVASDLTPALLDLGRRRAEEEDLDIEWVEADAEALPFDDARFDCVTSVFGAMFAPRPELVAQELFRVTRPGNTVGMANWTPDGFPGRLFDINAKYVPPPPDLPRPSGAWGVEEAVRQRFEGLAGTLDMERRTVRWEFPSADEMAAHFEQGTGPAVAMREALSEERSAAVREDVLALIREFDRGSGDGVAVDCEYLLVVARRRG